MKVILVKDLKNKGKVGDEIDVKVGFARNFLFPNEIALPATAANQRRFQDLKKKQLKILEGRRSEFEDIAKKLEGKTFTLKCKTHKGKLYGSITPNDVLLEIEAQTKITLEKTQVDIPDHIKETGQFEFKASLHPEISPRFKVIIESDSEVEEPTDYSETNEGQEVAQLQAEEKAEELAKAKEAAEKQAKEAEVADTEVSAETTETTEASA